MVNSKNLIYLTLFTLLFISIKSEPEFGEPIIPNQCGSLGSNNPMIANSFGVNFTSFFL